MTHFASRYRAAAHTIASDLGDDVTIDGESGHHLSRVRRLKEREVVTVADGHGTWRPYTIARVRRGVIDLHAHGEPVNEPPLAPRLAVAFALTKAAKPDLTVQKLTELGVDRVTPLRSRHTVPQWAGERAGAAVARLRRVALEAAAQCRRARLPEVETPQSLTALQGHPGLVVADPAGEEVAAIPAPANGEWVLVVGPEGGFDADELAAFDEGTRLWLAPHVLRAETAAIAGAAVLTTRRVIDWGDSE